MNTVHRLLREIRATADQIEAEMPQCFMDDGAELEGLTGKLSDAAGELEKHVTLFLGDIVADAHNDAKILVKARDYS